MAGVRSLAAGRKLSGHDVTAAAAGADPGAVELMRGLGQWLGHGAASLAAVLDPELIVIGGGVASAGGLLLDPARATFKQTLFASEFRPLPAIVGAHFGNDGGMIGAGDLARQP